MQTREIKVNSYVHPDNRPGVYVDHMDSAGLICRETNLNLLPQQHIDPSRLPNVAPTKQISDALTAEELGALEKHVSSWFICMKKFKTTSMENNPRSGNVAEYLKDQDLKTLAMYDHVQTDLAWAHGSFITHFIRMVAEDVGSRADKRRKNADRMYKAGYELIRRKNKNVACGGYVGYLKAVSQAILDKQNEFNQILMTKRLELRHRNQDQITKYVDFHRTT